MLGVERNIVLLIKKLLKAKDFAQVLLPCYLYYSVYIFLFRDIQILKHEFVSFFIKYSGFGLTHD